MKTIEQIKKLANDSAATPGEIQAGEIVFIRAGSPAVIVRGLHQDAPNPASEAHEAAAEVFRVSGFVQA